MPNVLEDGSVILNVYNCDDAMDLAKLLIRNGFKVQIGPMDSASTLILPESIPVTIFGFRGKFPFTYKNEERK